MKKRFLALVMVCILAFSSTALAIGGNGMGLSVDKQGSHYAQYRLVNKNLIFTPRLENYSNSLVNSVTIAIICYNAFEEPIYPDDDESGYVRYFTRSKGFAGGRVAPFGDCEMKGCADASYIAVAVTGYDYRDGPSIDLMESSMDDLMEQYNWTFFRLQ